MASSPKRSVSRRIGNRGRTLLLPGGSRRSPEQPSRTTHAKLVICDQSIDITNIRLPNDFCFLAAILDAFSRRVVGWHLAQEIDADLTLRALTQALAQRCPPVGFIHPSDRGVQYACRDYVQRLWEAGAQISMAAKG